MGHCGTFKPIDPATLPSTIPVFPLEGALLLPGGMLPLHIFEPRYVAMVEDVLAAEAAGRVALIGMIQPKKSCWPCGAPHLMDVGCAGRIIQCDKTPDGRYMLALQGVSRYRVVDELSPLRGYREVQAQWLQEADSPVRFDRTRLMPILRGYLKNCQLSCDWDALQNCPDDKLYTILAMVCPFAPCEQQALLEAGDNAERAAILLNLLAMASLGDTANSPLN
jgi:Lon protease-like protein